MDRLLAEVFSMETLLEPQSSKPFGTKQKSITKSVRAICFPMLALQVAQQFLDIPTIARLSMASGGVATMESWRSVEKHLWRARGEEEPWDDHCIPLDPLPLALAKSARALWLHIYNPLFEAAGREMACPGMLASAVVDIYVLGVNGCKDLSEQSLRNKAGLEHEQTEADAGFILRWIEDRDLGPGLIDVFLQMNGGNEHTTPLLKLVDAGDWTFRLFPPCWDEDIEDAAAILELEVFGFTIGIIVIEIFVDPFAFEAQQP